MSDLDEQWTPAQYDEHVIDGAGMSHQEIAKRLGITAKAVEAIEKSALEKLRSNPEAMALLVQFMQRSEECD